MSASVSLTCFSLADCWQFPHNHHPIKAAVTCGWHLLCQMHQGFLCMHYSSPGDLKSADWRLFWPCMQGTLALSMCIAKNRPGFSRLMSRAWRLVGSLMISLRDPVSRIYDRVAWPVSEDSGCACRLMEPACQVIFWTCPNLQSIAMLIREAKAAGTAGSSSI